MVCVNFIGSSESHKGKPGHEHRFSQSAQRHSRSWDQSTGRLKQLIKCNAYSACLPPNDVTVLTAVLDIDDKIE